MRHVLILYNSLSQHVILPKESFRASERRASRGSLRATAEWRGARLAVERSDERTLDVMCCLFVCLDLFLRKNMEICFQKILCLLLCFAIVCVVSFFGEMLWEAKMFLCFPFTGKTIFYDYGFIHGYGCKKSWQIAWLLVYACGPKTAHAKRVFLMTGVGWGGARCYCHVNVCASLMLRYWDLL